MPTKTGMSAMRAQVRVLGMLVDMRQAVCAAPVNLDDCHCNPCTAGQAGTACTAPPSEAQGAPAPVQGAANEGSRPRLAADLVTQVLTRHAMSLHGGGTGQQAYAETMRLHQKMRQRHTTTIRIHLFG